MAPTTRAGARRALFVDESTADEPSDACSRTNEDNGRARRKRRRSLDVFSYAYEQDVILRKRMAKFTAMFGCIFFMVMFMFAYEEEEEEEDDDVSTEEEEDEEDNDVSTEEDKDDVSTDIQEEEEDDTYYLDADLLECSLDCLKAVKARIRRELGPGNVICDEVIDMFEHDLDIDQDELKTAHDMFASKDRKFRSLMALSMDMRRDWLLIHIRKL
ncbi:uncharacterized protein LOC104584751 [Brachypodium distachyon]|uniref:Uncharacterized protein n=1 Tax=Brachypodium distachyon TaxID=15368 RepID=A0A2K2CTF2_BRADI|nr:uncharacterized protein LOC104584751 [Brachypodium distachyon]PNT65308.1 hypothetical protein BRADI_4g40130v3 [Brachypodium distachyon]|eukprot:XP_010238610.1 uncharacterized protein LOC104584751 [Brachypodium distachyon]